MRPDLAFWSIIEDSKGVQTRSHERGNWKRKHLIILAVSLLFLSRGYQSKGLNMIPTLRKFREGSSRSKFGGCQSRDIFRGMPVASCMMQT